MDRGTRGACEDSTLPRLKQQGSLDWSLMSATGCSAVSPPVTRGGRSCRLFSTRELGSATLIDKKKKTKKKQNTKRKTSGFGHLPRKVATSVSAIKAIWMTKIRWDMALILTLLHDRVALFDNKKVSSHEPTAMQYKKNTYGCLLKYILLEYMSIGNGRKRQRKKDDKEAKTLNICLLCFSKQVFVSLFVCFF